MAHQYTGELAVMCDTFKPLFPTRAALGMEDMKYPASWEGEHFPRLAAGQPVGGNFVDGKLKSKKVKAKFGDLVDMGDGKIVAPPPVVVASANGTHAPANGAAAPGANVWAPNTAASGTNGTHSSNGSNGKHATRAKAAATKPSAKSATKPDVKAGKPAKARNGR